MSTANGTSTEKVNYASDQDVRWCPGCGDYSILKQVESVLAAQGKPKEDIVFISGIGCSSRFPYYLDTYGMHGIHGRAPAIASVRKLEQRWLADLAARGHRRAPHQTWREFVATVANADLALAERLRPVATAFEQVAYAGRPLDAAERSAIEAQLVALRAN